MTNPTVTPVEARFKSLRDGAWGAAVQTDRDLTGHVIEVEQRNGAIRTVRLTDRVARFRDRRHPALYRFQDLRDVAPDREEPVTENPAPHSDWMEEGERAARESSGFTGSLTDLVASFDAHSDADPRSVRTGADALRARVRAGEVTAGDVGLPGDRSAPVRLDERDRIVTVPPAPPSPPAEVPALVRETMTTALAYYLARSAEADRDGVLASLRWLGENAR